MKNFKTFLSDCCTRAPKERAVMLRIWEAYLAWCISSSFPAITPEDFLEAFKQNGLDIDKGYILGLKLTDEMQQKLSKRISSD